MELKKINYLNAMTLNLKFDENLLKSFPLQHYPWRNGQFMYKGLL